MTTGDSSRFSGPLFFISVAGSVALVVVGVFFMFDTVRASHLYGVPLAAGPGAVYVSVAAVRDVAFGALALVFALLRDRRAAGLCVLLGALIPLGDALIVWTRSPTPLQFLPFHGGGVLGCLVFAFLLLRRCGES
jgi:Domain of unknown function (DUF4267)